MQNLSFKRLLTTAAISVPLLMGSTSMANAWGWWGSTPDPTPEPVVEIDHAWIAKVNAAEANITKFKVIGWYVWFSDGYTFAHQCPAGNVTAALEGIDLLLKHHEFTDAELKHNPTVIGQRFRDDAASLDLRRKSFDVVNACLDYHILLRDKARNTFARKAMLDTADVYDDAINYIQQERAGVLEARRKLDAGEALTFREEGYFRNLALISKTEAKVRKIQEVIDADNAYEENIQKPITVKVLDYSRILAFIDKNTSDNSKRAWGGAGVVLDLAGGAGAILTIPEGGWAALPFIADDLWANIKTVYDGYDHNTGVYTFSDWSCQKLKYSKETCQKVALVASFAVPGIADAYGIYKGLSKARRFARLKNGKILSYSCGGASFAPSTLVLMANGTYRPISAIHKGDMVASRDEYTGILGINRVTALPRSMHTDKVIIALSTGEGQEETVTTTLEHPFYVKGQGFVNAGKLEQGMVLISKNQPLGLKQLVSNTAKNAVLKIRSISKKYSGVKSWLAYNLTVARDQSYFVGKLQAWVHNVGCRPDLNAVIDTMDLRKYTVTSPNGGDIIVKAKSGDATYTAYVVRDAMDKPVIMLKSTRLSPNQKDLWSKLDGIEGQKVAKKTRNPFLTIDYDGTLSTPPWHDANGKGAYKWRKEQQFRVNSTEPIVLNGKSVSISKNVSWDAARWNGEDWFENVKMIKYENGIELPDYHALPGKRTGISPSTLGIAEIDGKQIKIMSGDGKPGSYVDGYVTSVNMETAKNWKPSSHVEGHVAGMMRESGIKKATVTINFPGDPCRRCVKDIKNMLPDETYELTVVYRTKSGHLETDIFRGIKDK